MKVSNTKSVAEFYSPPNIFHQNRKIYVYDKPVNEEFIGSNSSPIKSAVFIEYFSCLNNDYVMISLMHELEVQLVRALASVVNFKPSGAFKPITWRCIHYFIYCTILNYSKEL